MFFSEYRFEPMSFFEERYDEDAKLLYMKRNPGQDLMHDCDIEKMHPLLTSLEYALLLLDNERDIPRALDIISVCVSLRSKLPGNDSYGLFPYYLETYNKNIYTEIYTNTVSYKICTHFIYILKNHKNHLSKTMCGELENAVNNFLFRISGFYHVNHYIGFLQFIQVYLLIIGGDYFKDDKIFNSGIITLKQFINSVMYNENYHEYNSFYELSIVSEIMSELKTVLIDASLVSSLDEIYNILWKNISRNFHPEFRTLTGPFSNMSRNIPHNYFLYFLSEATGLDFEYETLENPPKILSRCPQKYLSEFTEPKQDKFIQCFVSKGRSYPSFVPSRIASNYICRDYTLGSFNEEDFFFETTVLCGHFRSEKPFSPYSFKLEVINGEYSLLAANFHSAQYNGTVLGAVSFSDNRHDVGYNFPSEKGIFTLSDFKIRLSIHGDASKLNATANADELIVSHENIFLRFKFAFVKFDDLPIEYTLEKNDDSLYFNALIGKGMNSKITFANLKDAICQFLLTIGNTPPANDCKCYYYKDKFIGEFKTDEFCLKTETKFKPVAFEEVMSLSRQYINDTLITDYVIFANTRAQQYKFIAKNNPTDLPNLTQNNELSLELAALETSPITMLSTKIQKLLRILSRENFTLDIFRHHSIYIINALFERVKHENLQYEQLINEQYSDIFHRISYMSDKMRIITLITDVTAEIQAECLNLSSNPHNRTIITNIINIIEKKYSDPNLSLSYLAEETGLSEPYISKQFKAVTGMTYVKYLTKLRMEKVIEFLKTGEDIETIAEKCGYANIFTFKRAFKQYSGKPITKWDK